MRQLKNGQKTVSKNLTQIHISSNIENITGIKELRKTKYTDRSEKVFDEKFINEYIGEYVSKIRVVIDCEEKMEVIISEFSCNNLSNDFNLEIANSLYKKATNYPMDKKYCKEIEITKDVSIIVCFENKLEFISCEVKEAQSYEKVCNINIKEKVTNITITYITDKDKNKKECYFKAHDKIYIEGYLNEVLNL